MKKRCSDLVLKESYDTLRFKGDCSKVTLSIPKSEDIGGWYIHAIKEVSSSLFCTKELIQVETVMYLHR